MADAVYGNLDQDALNREYSARDTVPDIDPFIAEYRRLSAEARSTLRCSLDVAYGPHPDEVVDVFPAGGDAPVLVYIHGGYWRMLSHRESAFMAPGMVAAGAAVVTVNYSLTPAATLDEIVRQCRAAVAWTWSRAAEFGGDPGRLFVCGSSAGGHLVGMTLAGGWQEAAGIPADAIRGAVPLNGLHDLEPVRLSSVNEWARLDAESARRNSPILHLPESGCPLIVSYGGSETSEFKRQSRIYADAWRARGWPVDVFEHPERNHFDIVFDLGDRDSLLGGKVFAMMGI